MATQELKDLIDSLPDIAKYKYPGAECYAFNSGKDNYVRVLLDTGELVIAAGSYTKESYVEEVREKVIGTGIFHGGQK